MPFLGIPLSFLGTTAWIRVDIYLDRGLSPGCTFTKRPHWMSWLSQSVRKDLTKMNAKARGLPARRGCAGVMTIKPSLRIPKIVSTISCPGSYWEVSCKEGDHGGVRLFGFGGKICRGFYCSSNGLITYLISIDILDKGRCLFCCHCTMSLSWLFQYVCVGCGLCFKVGYVDVLIYVLLFYKLGWIDKPILRFHFQSSSKRSKFLPNATTPYYPHNHSKW